MTVRVNTMRMIAEAMSMIAGIQRKDISAAADGRVEQAIDAAAIMMQRNLALVSRAGADGDRVRVPPVYGGITTRRCLCR